MGARYWSRMRKYSSKRKALTLHFTRHPGDPFIRVALANRPAHDIILLPENPTNQHMYQLVRDYTRAMSNTEARQLITPGVGTPTPK